MRYASTEPGIFVGDAHKVLAWLDTNVHSDVAEEVIHDLSKAGSKAWTETLLIFGNAPETSSYVGVPSSELCATSLIVDALIPSVSSVGVGGGRHTLYLCLSGVLLDRGVPAEDLVEIIRQVAIRAQVDDTRLINDRIKTAQSTVSRALTSAPHTRIGTLATFYPKVAQAVDHILPPKRSRAEEAILRALTSPPPSDGTVEPSLSEGSDLEVTEIALRALRKVGTEIVYTQGEFWSCHQNDPVWRPQGSSIIEAEIHKLDGAPYGEKGRFKCNQPRVLGAIKRAAMLLNDETFFDDAPRGIAFSNGFLQVSATRQSFDDINPSHRVTQILPFVFDEDATSPLWDKFLSELFACDTPQESLEKQKILQQFVGACLLNIVTWFQCCAALTGDGDNGKSVFLEMVSALFSFATVASVPPHRFDREYDVAGLAGKSVNIVAESPRVDIVNTEIFKAIVSGDMVQGRHPYQKPFRFKPVAGHFFACNELHGTGDQSLGYWKRWIVIKFTRTFKAEEMDRLLKEKLLKELPGIVNWALLGGYEALVARAFSIPTSSTLAKKEWKRGTDQVELFADERLARVSEDVKEHVLGSTIYKAYRDWSLENGYKPLNNTHFGTRLKALGWSKQHTDRGEKWAAKLRGPGFLYSIPGSTFSSSSLQS